MSIARKDIRAKLDPDMHRALTVLCEADGVDLGEFIERELVLVIKHRVHASQFIAANAPGLGKAGKAGGKAGKAGGKSGSGQE